MRGPRRPVEPLPVLILPGQAAEGNLVSGGGGRITPCLRHSALRAAALRATFSGACAPPSNLFRFSSSPAKPLREILFLVEGGGFEPPKAEPSDLQSDPFDRSGTPPKKRPYSLATSDGCQPVVGRFKFPASQEPRKHVLASPPSGASRQLSHGTAVRTPNLIYIHNLSTRGPRSDHESHSIR